MATSVGAPTRQPASQAPGELLPAAAAGPSIRSRIEDLATWQNVVLGGLALLLLYLAGGPLVLLVYGMLRDAPPGAAGSFTFAKLIEAYGDAAIYTTLLDTFIYSVGTTLVSLSIGAVLAWLVERTNVPLRSVLYSFSIVRVVIPMMLAVIGWILLLSPTIGLINKLIQGVFGLQSPPFDIYSRWGMIFTEGVDLVPIGFLLSVVALHSIDPAQEEAAAVAGSSPLRALRTVTLPLASPGLLAAALLLFLDAFDSIEVPTFIGLHARIHTLSTAVYEASEGTPSDLNLASAYGGGFLLLAALGMLVYQWITRRASRFATISGRGYQPRRLDLGRWRWPVCVICLMAAVLLFGLPVLVLLWASLLPFYAAPSPEALARVSLENYAFVFHYPTTVRAITNSLTLALWSATAASLLTLAASWLVIRSSNRWGRALDLLVFAPKAFPGVVLGLSLLWIYLSLPFNLYGTLWVIGIAYVTRFMPLSMRFSYAAMIQVRRELEEAGQISGGSWPYNFRRIILPLAMSGFVSSWIYVAAYSFRELSASLLLAGPGNEVAAVTIWDLWNNGQTGPVAAFCITMLCLLIVLLGLFRVLAGRFSLQVADPR